MQKVAPLWWAVMLVASLSGPASANGLDLGPGGTRSVGRGGAVAARPVDPMAMQHNPAGLPRLSGDQILFNLDFGLDDMCFDPYGYYGWGVYLQPGVETESDFGDPTSSEYSTRLLDGVCNSAPTLPTPQLAWAFHATDRLSVALGFVAPTLAAGVQWGGKNGTIVTDDGPRPTPTRYQMIHQEVEFGLNPAVSVGYRLIDELSVGATFHVVMAKASSYAMTGVNPGTQPDDDMLTKLTAEDFFIPGATVAVHAEPLRGLSLMAALRMFDSFSGPGEIASTTNYYHQAARGSEPAPHENSPVRLRNVRVGIPWALTTGVRYAQLLPSAEGPLGGANGDPLATELWDVELDFTWNLNKLVGEPEVAIGDDILLQVRSADGTPQKSLMAKKEDIEDFAVEGETKDSIALRLGGSYHPIPNLLGFNAGAFYESRGQDPAYATVDSFAFRRFGLGLGAVVRLGGFDLLVSYSHIFQEDVTVAPPPHEPRDRAVPDDPTSGFDQRLYEDGELTEEPVPDDRAPTPAEADGVASYRQGAALPVERRRARPVNAGLYTASFDIISVGFVYRY